MTTIDPPWELSQITEKARAKHDRRRTRRLLHRGRLTEYLDRPCPYCGVAMTDWICERRGEDDGWPTPPRRHRCGNGGRPARLAPWPLSHTTSAE